MYNNKPEVNNCPWYTNIYNIPLFADRICNDETNTEECKWDGGDCCGESDMTKCSDCECLESFKWNDNNCEEFRRFICEKEGTG